MASSSLAGTWDERRCGIVAANASLVARGRDAAAAATRASARCGGAAAEWRQLQAEAVLVPESVRQMGQLAEGVAAACAQIDRLENRLLEASVARGQQREAAWRQTQLAEAEQREARGEAELEALRAEAARRALRREREAADERQRAFQKQYEAQRAYVQSHGLLRPAAPSGGAEAHPLSLAEAQPGASAGAGEDDLDAFYADD